jgi:hypothetical protein
MRTLTHSRDASPSHDPVATSSRVLEDTPTPYESVYEPVNETGSALYFTALAHLQLQIYQTHTLLEKLKNLQSIGLPNSVKI